MDDPFKLPSGPEYEKMVEEFIMERFYFLQMINLGVALSDKSGGIITSNQFIASTKLFTRIVLSSMTIDRILPDKRTWTMWDVSSFFCLSRAFIETIYAFIYIGVDKCDEKEISFRLKLLNYHRNLDKYKLFYQTSDDSKARKEFEIKLKKERDEIEKNEFFSVLDKEKQKGILSGRYEMTKTREDLSELIPSDFLKNNHRFIYKLLSNHLHSSPFSFLSQDNDRGRGRAGNVEVHYFGLILSVINTYYAYANIKHAEIFYDHLWKQNSKSLELAKKLIERKKYGEMLK